jgi:hypothetical protein
MFSWFAQIFRYMKYLAFGFSPAKAWFDELTTQQRRTGEERQVRSIILFFSLRPFDLAGHALRLYRQILVAA